MNIEHLEYILEVYKCGSVNKAARSCYISQSHLSTIIRSVENEIGYALFHRTPSGLAVTREGQVFMSHAEKIVAEQGNIYNIPKSLAESDSLSIVCSRAPFVFQCFLDYKKQYPSTGSSYDTFLEAGLRENLRTVTTRKCSLGIMVMFEQVIPKYVNLADQYNLELSILQRIIPVTVFMAQDHPLAREKVIRVENLANYPFIADMEIDRGDTLDILGLQSHSDLLYVCDRGTIFDAVCKEGYIAIGIGLPDEDCKRLGCLCRPIEDGADMSVGVLHSRILPVRAREKHFIDYLAKRLHSQYNL